MIEFYTAISVGCALDSVARAYRGALERLQGLGVVEEGCARDLASTHENGSLGMQCDKIVDFSEGTDAKSANLPKNPQSLHSHTANTNFVACSSEITESTTPKNLSKALPNINNVRNSASRAESMAIDSAIFAQQKSNKICSAAAHTDARPCRGGKNQEQGGSSATADFSKETSFSKEACALPRQGDSEALSPIAQKDPTGCKRSAAKTAALYSFRGWGERGEGKPFFFLRKQAMMRS